MTDGIRPPGVRPPEPPPPPEQRQRSLVLVNTGDGKVEVDGRVRGGHAWRRAPSWNVAVIQFIKSGKWVVGGGRSPVSWCVDWLKGGDGFTCQSPPTSTPRRVALAEARPRAATIAAGEHQLVVLDGSSPTRSTGAGSTARRFSPRSCAAPRTGQPGDHGTKRAGRAARDRRHRHRDAQAEARL